MTSAILRSLPLLCAVCATAVATSPARAEQPAPRRPNIVWIIVDDMSANFSCYGETTIETPHVDRLAREGTRFRRAFVTAPVCSPSRSALITGMYQTTIGAQHHRSGRGAEGIHVPLVIRGPGIACGKVRDDLVEHIDIAATSLALAGIAVPRVMQGRDLFARNAVARDAVFSARDRCDETVDRIRSVRTERFKYIRNFYPARGHLQPNRYKDAKAIVGRLRELHEKQQLDAAQELLLFAPTRPKEELYDLESDPDEIRNLADDPSFGTTLEELRRRLDRWIEETGDQSRQPESRAMYDSDMAVYLGSTKETENTVLRKNIAIMKLWAAEGK